MAGWGLRRLAAWLLILSLLVVACGRDDETVRSEEGRIPDSVPSDFPVPPGAVIGSTMVDKAHDRTEFSITVGSDLPSVVQFYTISLVNQGYLIQRSESIGETTWQMIFIRGDLTGEILVSSDGGGASRAVVSVDTA